MKDAMPSREKRKVVVIGAGAVGTTYIYSLLHSGVADEIALIDIDKERVLGEVMDLSHGLPFISPVTIEAGDYADCQDAKLIVITAGTKQKPGESRLDLIQRNAQLVGAIADEIGRHGNDDAVVVVVTNPVDVLTYVVTKRLNRPRGRVIGSGTVLDSARFRYRLSQLCEVDVRNVHAYILGEHGDTEFAAWSMAHIGGVPLDTYCRGCRGCDFTAERARIEREVRETAYHIIDYKGATYFGIGLSLARISEAILRDEHSVLTVSALLEGEYGLSDVCLSVPRVVGHRGVESTIVAPLAPDEQTRLEQSAAAIKEALRSIQPS